MSNTYYIEGLDCMPLGENSRVGETINVPELGDLNFLYIRRTVRCIPSDHTGGVLYLSIFFLFLFFQMYEAKTKRFTEKSSKIDSSSVRDSH